MLLKISQEYLKLSLRSLLLLEDNKDALSGTLESSVTFETEVKVVSATLVSV